MVVNKIKNLFNNKKSIYNLYKWHSVYCVIFIIIMTPTFSQETSLTIYSSADPAGFNPQQFISEQPNGYDANFIFQVPGFAVVRSSRNILLTSGINKINFTDVAAFLDPTSVSFTDLTEPSTLVLEQDFQFDLVNPTKLLQKYVDHEVTIRRNGPKQILIITGNLLAANQNQLVLATNSGIELIPKKGSEISLNKLPGGLLTRPTLIWKLKASKSGEHKIQTTYQTAGMTWRADYNLVLNKNDTLGDITSWVTIMNLSGLSYDKAQLKLIAGDVQKIQPTTKSALRAQVRARAKAASTLSTSFTQESFSEYHLYTLPRKINLPMNTTKQIAMFPGINELKVKKNLIFNAMELSYGNNLPRYYSTSANINPESASSGTKSAEVFITFKNSKENKLGIPLPKGKVRVYKENPNDNTMEFIGEDLINHTPLNEKVNLRIGKSFDVVGERTVVGFVIDNERKTLNEKIKIEIRNHKKKAQSVIVQEPMYRWRNWEITQSKPSWQKLNASMIEFTLNVPAASKQIIEYTVKYTW